MSAILVTVQDGTADYVDDGEVEVVIVDFDALDPDTTFPEDINVLIQKVFRLPHTIPWRAGVIKRLNEVKTKCKRSIEKGDTYADRCVSCRLIECGC